jgi:hypothetical protein
MIERRFVMNEGDRVSFFLTPPKADRKPPRKRIGVIQSMDGQMIDAITDDGTRLVAKVNRFSPA